MPIEADFDIGFIARLASEEKQIQQNYRPVIGVHKWFARRPGALFRGLLLSEYATGNLLSESYYSAHDLAGLTILDPFMGGGTTLFEANRIGCNVIGFDINPMAYWVVRQELASVDRSRLRSEASAVVSDVDRQIRSLYQTRCGYCDGIAEVKYFLWIKQQRCADCGDSMDLFPGYLIATNDRHSSFVLYCPCCSQLAEFSDLPSKSAPAICPLCSHSFSWAKGTASRNRYKCSCGHEGRYPAELRKDGPPQHRLFALEYHCEKCKPGFRGRFFKTADSADHDRFTQAQRKLAQQVLPCPVDEIPDGDETKRLQRWGYRYYREMFNDRQLLSLGLLLSRIRQVEDSEARHALATVFSDSLRYQNMLCRYDTYALKCQDIFSVHGFPVGLMQCENNVLGIPGVGSGSFLHFVEKYDRAKAYCEAPFETIRSSKTKKRLQNIAGEKIAAHLVTRSSDVKGSRRALLLAQSIDASRRKLANVDGVFTDPPYYDNVQYAELMDFCFSWLRLMLSDEFPQFDRTTTRSAREFTGNKTEGRDLLHFTEGLSGVFTKAADTLKPGAPFVFTYHHNDVEAYVPVVIAILDAGLRCTATLPCPAEMTASLHINGTGSSVIDTIVVCRKHDNRARKIAVSTEALLAWLRDDIQSLSKGRIACSRGDLSCLAMGHLARAAISQLRDRWRDDARTAEKMAEVTALLDTMVKTSAKDSTIDTALSEVAVAADELLLFSESL